MLSAMRTRTASGDLYSLDSLLYKGVRVPPPLAIPLTLDSMSVMTYIETNVTNRQTVGLAARGGQDTSPFFRSPN